MSDLQRTHAQKKRNLDSLEVSSLQPHRVVVQTQAQKPSLLTQTELCEHYQRTKQLGAKKENISVHNPEQALKIQAKLTISQPGDEYEQEANRVAAAVVRRMNNSDVEQSDQSKSVQRQELSQEEKERTSTESEVTTVPKEEEATLQTKSLSGAIQRQKIGEEEEKLEAEPEAGATEEVPEEQEEELQTKLETGATQLQMQSDGQMRATADLETSIQQARGGGQTMADTIRQPMEQSFGVNFSSVRIHTDAQSDTLNKSIQARAFTTGQDIFFKQGEYNPGSQSGQELLAHELTHVVQQNTQLGQINNPNVRQQHHTISPSILKIQRFGEGGHEKATEKGLQGMFTEEQMKEIQFGNWKTDMNQISLAIPYFKKVGINLTEADCLEIVTILAIDKFGEKIGSRLTATSLGTYSEAEHFDNPNKNKEDAKVQSFFKKSISLISENLQDIVFKGNTSAGRELLGNTLHIIQDIYAHSNFVEIALKLKGKPIDTMGGVTSSGDLIMTSGIFGGLDTAISIAKIIADKLKEPAKKGNKLSAGTRIAIIILNRNGYRHVSETYLKALDMVEKGKKAIIGMVPERFQGIAEAAIHKIEALFQNAKESICNKFGNAINYMAEIASKFTGGGEHPSHSKLAKDSDSEKRRLYPLAINLATVATQAFGNKVQQIWDLKANNADQNQINSELKILNNMVKEYMGHPQDTKWWESQIKL